MDRLPIRVSGSGRMIIQVSSMDFLRMDEDEDWEDDDFEDDEDEEGDEEEEEF